MKKNITFRLLSSTTAKARDTGLAIILICLLTAHFGKIYQFVPISIIILLIVMIFPNFFKPFAWFWFGLSHILGTVASKIILSILFFVLVTPVGFIRRLAGADTLQLKEWKKSNESVFKVRDHKFSAEDVEKPY